jgi:5-(carboxyamino)imidazole ribonucleotide mutase
VKGRAVGHTRADPGVRVGVVMGSQSDLGKMSKAWEALAELGIGYEVRVISAHRTPDEAVAYARGAEERGLCVIIAGAGGAAHLAGVVAAYTVLPVIGVPVASGALGGFDALCATVMMPPGVPVATVAIDGAANAGILAAEIVALLDQEVRERLAEYRRSMAERVRQADVEVQAKTQMQIAGGAVD